MKGMKKTLFFVACLFLCLTFVVKLSAESLGSPVEVSAEKWLNADSFSLEDNKDKVVVLEFWATWCPPCRASIPHLKELSDKYKDKVVFVSLTNESADQRMENFCKSNNMTWIIGLGSNSGRDYRVTSIPHAFIIANNEIVWHGHPMDPKFENKLASLGR